MPQHSSVRPSREISADGVNLSHVEDHQQNNTDPENRVHHNPRHMTLDGRRRPKPSQNSENTTSTVNEGEHWRDWTSTWRKMGTKGHGQPVTMTGTITRGKKKGQVVDVQLDLTDRELMELSTTHERSHENIPESPSSLPSTGIEPKSTNCGCGLKDGPHVFLLSLLMFPFILIASLFASFYFGALTWQNIFNYFYDERTIWHRIFLCPLLVLSFPFFIVIFTIGIAIYAAFIQLRWSFLDWKDEVGSLEKGFYGWLCGKLSLEDCSPYTVVELFNSTDIEGAQRQQQDGDSRVAVVYTEQNTARGNLPSEGREQRNSLPTGTSHSRMQRMESAM